MSPAATLMIYIIKNSTNIRTISKQKLIIGKIHFKLSSTNHGLHAFYSHIFIWVGSLEGGLFVWHDTQVTQGDAIGLPPENWV